MAINSKILKTLLILVASASLVSCKKNEGPASTVPQENTTETTSNNGDSSDENSGEENKDNEEEKTVDVELPYI